jgi:hypothetical protein
VTQLDVAKELVTEARQYARLVYRYSEQGSMEEHLTEAIVRLVDAVETLIEVIDGRSK